jgi:hypothetical protein
MQLLLDVHVFLWLAAKPPLIAYRRRFSRVGWVLEQAKLSLQQGNIVIPIVITAGAARQVLDEMNPN